MWHLDHEMDVVPTFMGLLQRWREREASQGQRHQKPGARSDGVPGRWEGVQNNLARRGSGPK